MTPRARHRDRNKPSEPQNVGPPKVQPFKTQEDRARWVEAETERRLREEETIGEIELEPLDNFPPQAGWFRNDGEPPPNRRAGEECKALAAVIASSCNGWPSKPTAAEAEQVMKSRTRGSREDAIAWTIATESSVELVMEAEEDGGYSLQDLAWWIRELQIPAYKRIRWLNAMSRGWTGQQRRAAQTATR